MRRAALLLLLLPLLAGCAQDEPDVVQAAPAGASEAAAPSDPQALLAGVTAAVQQAGTVGYEAVSESVRDGQAPRVELRLSGALDLPSGAGTGALELPGFVQLAAEAKAAGEPSTGADLGAMSELALSWTPDELSVDVEGRRQTVPRDASDTSLVARVPAEPAGLLAAVAAASDVRAVGSEDVDGVRTTRLTGSLSPRAAVDAGLGTQAQLSVARLPSLPVDVWVDGDGRPARIRYVAEVPGITGRTTTMTTTYDYRGWGEPVDVTP